MTKLTVLTGRRFGRLTVIRRAPDGAKVRWFCRCDCGVDRIVQAGDLVAGKTKSCGCLSAEIAKEKRIHPKHLHYELDVWKTMIQRCTNQNSASFTRYGARGIRVADRWVGRDGFRNFIADMGNRPSADYSIDRIDNDGDYEPVNCRWATRTEQSNNTRTNRKLTFQGETKTLADWSRCLGMNYYTLHTRLRHGWSDHDTLNTPVNKNKGHRGR